MVPGAVVMVPTGAHALQEPLLHAAVPQSWPQDPQFLASVAVSTHAPLHSFFPAAQA